MSSEVHIQLPSKSDIQKALGDSNEKTKDFIFDHKFLESFDDLPLPQSESDWLAQYAEKGQTYREFVQVSRTLGTPATVDRKIIYLTLFGSSETFLVDMNNVRDYAQRYFQLPVKQIDVFKNIHWDDEKYGWTGTLITNNDRTRNFNIRARYDETTKHSQIRVHGILNLLKKVVPMDAKCLIALSSYDLYDDDSDLFIAGLSLPNNRVASFSLFRYDPYLEIDESNWFEYNLKKSDHSAVTLQERQRLILLRACRLLTHEICHLFGIAHCIFFACLLNGSGNLDEDFRQPLLECPIDLRKLRSLVHFNCHSRYQDLLEFFREHRFENEANMVEKKLKIINEFVENDRFLLESSLKRKLTNSDIKLKTTPYSLRKRKPTVHRLIDS